MRGNDQQDEQLEEFIAARTQDLHHDAYQLSADQDTAEQLVVAVLADLRRRHVDMAQAGATARVAMARVAARDDTPTEITDVSQLPDEFQVLARLSPRQRAVLVLQVVDNYDERETARALQLSSHTVGETLRSIPYDELPGASPHSGELRSLLDAFGDRAGTPSAATTLTDVRTAPPPPRRPWWTYVAALLVIALTVTTVVVTQSWHKDWLRTPEGLNHAHGTHFPAYTQGYKLVAIHEVAPGPAEDIPVGPSGAVALECHPGDRTVSYSVSSGLPGTYFQNICSTAFADATDLVPVIGTAHISISNFQHETWPVAAYKKVPRDEYPVATGDFDVQTDLTLAAVRKRSLPNDDRPADARGPVLTLHGAAEHPNGTFRGSLRLPSTAGGTMVQITGLLSPTTTGHYRLRVDERAPWTTCGNQGPMTYQQSQLSQGCSLLDHRVPQVEFELAGMGDLEGRTVPVEITVRGATGPWTLQVAADRFTLNHRATHGPTSVQTN